MRRRILSFDYNTLTTEKEREMQIVVYLANGQTLEFIPADAAHEDVIIEEINSGRLFSGKSLILGSQGNCTMIQTSAVARIDIISEKKLSVPHSMEGRLTLIDDEGDFQKLLKSVVAKHGEGISPGEEFDGCFSFNMTGNHRANFSFHGVLRDQLQFFSNLKRAFEIPTMWFEHPRGGAVAIHVPNVVALSSSPGFSQYPKGTLLVKPS